jgi:hypothetical protein
MILVMLATGCQYQEAGGGPEENLGAARDLSQNQNVTDDEALGTEPSEEADSEVSQTEKPDANDGTEKSETSLMPEPETSEDSGSSGELMPSDTQTASGEALAPVEDPEAIPSADPEQADANGEDIEPAETLEPSENPEPLSVERDDQILKDAKITYHRINSGNVAEPIEKREPPMDPVETHVPTAIFLTKEEFDEFAKDAEPYWNYEETDKIYDSAFFEENALIVFAITDITSGSISFKIPSISVQDGTMDISVYSVSLQEGFLGTADMADWYCLVELPKEHVKDIEAVTTHWVPEPGIE